MAISWRSLTPRFPLSLPVNRGIWENRDSNCGSNFDFLKTWKLLKRGLKSWVTFLNKMETHIMDRRQLMVKRIMVRVKPVWQDGPDGPYGQDGQNGQDGQTGQVGHNGPNGQDGQDW